MSCYVLGEGQTNKVKEYGNMFWECVLSTYCTVQAQVLQYCSLYKCTSTGTVRSTF